MCCNCCTKELSSDGNGRTGRFLINYELLKNKDIEGLALFLKELSNVEKERLNSFDF